MKTPNSHLSSAPVGNFIQATRPGRNTVCIPPGCDQLLACAARRNSLQAQSPAR